MYPEAADESSSPTSIPTEDHARLAKELGLLGFSPAQSRIALAALSQPSGITSSLLGRLPPLQACIEFLLLQIPECDLPKRFLPSVTSSDPFVTAVHSGTENLKRRWIEEKAVKECGWPTAVVKECISQPKLEEDWGKLVFSLNCRLMGAKWEDVSIQANEVETIDNEELESLGGQMATSGELILPLPVAPLILHMIVAKDLVVPASGTHPPMYLTSSSVPAYVRLHILSKVILTFISGTLREPAETVLMAMMRIIEEEWAIVEDDGPPNISEVLQFLLPQRSEAATASDNPGDTLAPIPSRRRISRKPRGDDRTDERVKDDFERLRSRGEYAKMLAIRERLPAFTAKKRFLDVLGRNRCVIVVGETGVHTCALFYAVIER